MLDAKANEERILRYWKDNRIEDKVREKGKGKKKFYFLDGPPFVTGDLHQGQIWTKGLKDAFVRYKRYRDLCVVDRPGYDVHGLPIENKVEKELGITSKKDIEQRIGIESFISECKRYVDGYIGRLDADYERFGISLNFKDPYLPHRNEYIESAWSIFKLISDRNFLYQGKRTLIYCPHCETPLSQGSMEVEYADEQDPSLFLMFKIDAKRSKFQPEFDDSSYLLVWTTTPWTIPANVSIAANPEEIYVISKMDTRKVVLAKKRIAAVERETGAKLEILREFKGAELEGTRYLSPLESKMDKQKELRKYHRIILSKDMVSMEDGTGLVHIAPGHGMEDYLLGMKSKLPLFSPLNPDATYSPDAGAYRGLKVPGEANEFVLKDLKALGAVLHSGTVTHSYPHCWRCASKLIFMATDQWFFNVQKIRKKMLKENERIFWQPEEVRKWQESLLVSSPDWCISRQRYWGTPMPIWLCDGCGGRSVIGSLSELREKSKAPLGELKDLHRPYIDAVVLRCDKCGGDMHRVKDVLDGWFDSGITFRASLKPGMDAEGLLPVDLIVEYVEQIRAWFQYLQKCSIMAYGKRAFNTAVVHGILFGEDGRKMSKSFGNYKPLAEMLKVNTADAFRLWSINHIPIQNRSLNEGEIRDSDKMITILYNIANLLKEYEQMNGSAPTEGGSVAKGSLGTEELWIMSRVESLNQLVTESFDSFEAYKAAGAIKDFIIEDFSRFYLKFAKARITESGKRSARNAINVLNYVLRKVLILTSPITPFVSEAIFTERYKGLESVFLSEWPKPAKRFIDEDLEERIGMAKEAMSAALNARDASNVSLRTPIAKVSIEVDSEASIAVLEKSVEMIKFYTNAKSVSIGKYQAAKKELKPNFGALGKEFKSDTGALAEALKKLNPEAIEKEIRERNSYALQLNGKRFEIKPEHFSAVETEVPKNAVRFRHGTVTLDTTMTAELEGELFLREVSRRIQSMRKDLGLTRVDTVSVMLLPDEKAKGSLKGIAQIKGVVRASGIKVVGKLEDPSFHQKEFEIQDSKIRIGIRKDQPK